MTKRELVEALAGRQGVSKRQAEQWLDSFTDIVMKRVTAGEKVAITGFGVFILGQRAARRGVDPRSGVEISIPAMPIPRFRVGKRFKQVVRS